MKYYKQNNEVFAYEEDGSQDHLIGDKVLMTVEEVELHINPPKTEEQLLFEQIQEAKAYLSSTDYIVTKLSEYQALGESTAELLVQYADVLTQRKEAREFIGANQ